MSVDLKFKIYNEIHDLHLAKVHLLVHLKGHR